MTKEHIAEERNLERNLRKILEIKEKLRKKKKKFRKIETYRRKNIRNDRYELFDPNILIFP